MATNRKGKEAAQRYADRNSKDDLKKNVFKSKEYFKATPSGREEVGKSRMAFDEACRKNPDTGPCRSMYPETNGTPPTENP